MASDPAPEMPASDGPRLVPQGSHAGKPPFPLNRLAVVIGSERHCRLQLTSSSVSKHHAVVITAEDGTYIADLGSRTKVVVNGQAARDRMLKDGDEVRIGKFIFTFRAADNTPPRPQIAVTRAVIVDEAGVSATVDDRILVVGSRSGCDVAIEEAAVSGRHAVIFQAAGKRYIRDLNSRTGSFLNGTRVRQKEIAFGDQIRIGGTTLHLESTEPKAPAASPAVSGPPGFQTSTVFRDAGGLPIPAAPAAPAVPQDAIAEPPPVAAQAEPPAPQAAPETDLKIDLIPSTPPPQPIIEPPPVAQPSPLIEPLLSAGPLSAVADEVDLNADPDISGNADGPGDTAMLKPAPAAPAVELSPAASHAPLNEAAASPVPEEDKSDNTDSATGSASEISWPRRGWRGESLRSTLSPQSAPAPVQDAVEPFETTPQVSHSSSGETSHTFATLDAAALHDPSPPPAEPSVIETSNAPALPDAPAPLEPSPQAIEPSSSETSNTFATLDAAVLPEPPPQEVPSSSDIASNAVKDTAATAEAAAEAAPAAPKRGRPTKGSSPRKSLLERATVTRTPPSRPAEELEPAASDDESPALSPPPAAPAPVVPPAPAIPVPDAVAEMVEVDFYNLKLDLKPDASVPEQPPQDESPSALVAMESNPRRDESSNETFRPLVVGEEVSHGSNGDAEIFEASIRHEPAAPPSPDEQQPETEVELEPVLDLQLEPEVEPEPQEAAEPPIVGLEISEEDFPAAADAEVQQPAPSPPAATQPAHDETAEPVPDEVLEAFDSTVGATLDLDSLLPPSEPAAAAPPAEMDTSAATMDDTAFGETVQALVGESTGPLVEATAAPQAQAENVAPPAPQVENPPSPAPPAPPMLPVSDDLEFKAPMILLGGTATFGIGAVNVDHFLGGMPLRFQVPPSPAPVKPPLFGKSPISFEGSWSQPLADANISEPADAPPPAAKPSGPSPAAPPQPQPQQAAPKKTPTAPAPFAKGKPFSSETLDIVPQDIGIADTAAGAAAASSSPAHDSEHRLTTAFDGLGLGPASEKDVFSGFPAPVPKPPAVEAPPPASKDHDPVFPESPPAAEGAAPVPDTDFAEDEFWNRTDDDEGLPPLDMATIQDALPVESADRFDPPPPASPAARRPPATAPASPPPQPAAVATAEPPAKRPRRRWLIPFLMLAMLVSMAASMVAIRILVPARSHVTGSLTYLNFNWVQGTNDGNDFQAAQQRLLQNDQTRLRAVALLGQQHRDVSPGFLGDFNLYLPVARSMTLSSQRSDGVPQTILTLSLNGADETAERYRMTALLAAMAGANAPVLDENRRLRGAADSARREADDAVASVEQLKSQIASLQHTVSQQPSADELASLTQKKTQLQQTRFTAEDVVDRDRTVLARLQAELAASAPTTQPGSASELGQLRHQISDLTFNLQAARQAQTSGVITTRTQLQDAAKQLADQLLDAAGAADKNSPLMSMIDAATDALSKLRPLLAMASADGEDLEKQLKDARRDLEESIQARQQQKWAADPRLQELQADLDSTQHRYNAAQGEGVTDPGVLQPLARGIDELTAQIKSRQAEVTIDPSEVKADDGASKLIDSLRGKLQKEMQQIGELLDPLEGQMTDLANASGGLPTAQLRPAQQILRRLASLSDARQRYTDAVTQVRIAPSQYATDTQKQIDQLQARLDHLQMALSGGAHKTDSRTDDLAAAQKKLTADKTTLAQATNDYNAVRAEYDRQTGLRVAAGPAQTRLLELNDLLRQRSVQLDAAVRDRDQKQALADRSFDLKPLGDGDVISSSSDPRWIYSLYAVAGVAVVFALATFVASHGGAAAPLPPTAQIAPEENIVTAELVGDHDVDDEDDHEAAVV